MSDKHELKTDFIPSAIEPFYTGGDVSISSDGKYLATTFDSEVIITNFKTGERLVKVRGDGEDITALEVSPDSQYLVTCSRSLSMKTYTLPDGELVRTVKAHESPVIVMTIDPTSTLIATGGAEGAVKVWDIAGGFATHSFRGHAGMISAVRFWGFQGSNEWLLASASDQDYKIRVWDLVKQKSIASFEQHDSVVRGLDFSADGSVLISGGRDKVINVWDMKKKKHTVTIPALDTVETLGFLRPGIFTQNPDEQIVYAGGESGTTRLWSLKNFKIVASREHRQSTEEISVTRIIYQPEADLFISVLSDDTLLQLSLSDLSILQRIAGNNGEIIDCALVGENEKFLAIATSSPEVRIVERGSLNHNVLSGHTEMVMTLDRSVDGFWLATAGKDKQARLWDLSDVDTNEASIQTDSYAVFSGHIESIGAIALPKTPSKNIPGTTKFQAPRFVVTGSQDLTVKLWNIPKTRGGEATTVYTRKAHDKDINAIDVSPDDRMFATASQDRTAKIWDLESGEVIAKLSGHKRGVWCVKFNPYDKVIATGSGDMTIKLWSLKDFTVLKTFQGHTNSILNLGFLTYGQQLASAAADYLIKVWDLKSGECNATLDYHKDRVWTLATTENDECIVSGGSDGVITYWKDVTEEKKEEEKELEKEALLKQQQLDNYVRSKDWKNAIVLALSMNHPYQALKLFTTVFENNSEPNSILGLVSVDQAIATLDDDKILTRLLSRVRDWNTNARTSAVAQAILNTILCYYSIDKLCSLEGVSKMIDGLIPYTERHLNKNTELIEEGYTVDYILQLMEKVTA